MKITFLGTNGWYDTKTGNTVCTLIQDNGYDLILDAGSGLAKLNKYCSGQKPVYLFISHLHLDHIIGLHTLVKNKFSEGLKIIIPRNSGSDLMKIIGRPFTVSFDELPFRVKLYEAEGIKDELPFNFRCLPLLHKDDTLGYRFELGSKTITYCADTGYCQNAVSLAKNADLLITECSLIHKGVNPKWPHLSPEEAAEIAVEADARQLVLTHFDANKYPTLASRRKAEKVARDTFSNTVCSTDGMVIELYH